MSAPRDGPTAKTTDRMSTEHTPTERRRRLTTLLRMTGITKSFPGVLALRGAELELRAGEVHALMGENGAGKSTLMKILAGIQRADDGEIRLDGEVVQLSSPRQAQAAGVSIIHQELALMNDLTAAQNIFIGREPKMLGGFLLDERELNARAEKIFASMHLQLDPRVRVGKLTVAKQQMAEIAKVLSHRSRILIMDEPTAALNDKEIDELFAIIDRLRAEGVGIVYISHKMDEIKRISDRITVMRDGAYIGTVDTPSTEIGTIISMMVGRSLTDEVAGSTPANAPVVLEVKGLTRGKAVRAVDLALRKGEILGFAGLMGAGRTELARAIFGADPIDSGEILVDGRSVSIRSPADAVKAGIGYLSEDRKHFGLALDLASLGSFKGAGGLIDERRMQDVARRYIDTLAIRTPSDAQYARLLSGGNQQKIVIAKWLLRDCPILIFDEPPRGIDVGAKSEIYKLLNALAADGKAIIVISSELPEVIRLSHRIAVMCEGRLTGFLPSGATQEEIMHLATKRETMVAQDNKAEAA